jgi:uncharacterized Zn finger protein (UPF0148 family)
MKMASISTQRCKICGVRLSLYNDDILCFSCQEKEQEQTLNKEFREPHRGKIVFKIITHETRFTSCDPCRGKLSYLR